MDVKINCPEKSQSQKVFFCFDSYSDSEVIQRFEKLVRTERKITHLVLLHIAEIDKRKIYADLGFDGMYTYLTRGLGYSEGSAVRRLQSARLLLKVPAVAEKIESGTLNLSQLAKVQKCLKDNKKTGEVISPEKTLEILEKIENQNSFETQKILASEMNMPVQDCERIRPQQNETVRIEITLSQEEFAELERAKSLLSHICHGGSLGEVIGVLAKKFNKAKLEGRRLTASDTAAEVVKVPNTTVKPAKEIRAQKSGRKYISVQVKRSLLKKSGYCCEFKDPKTQRQCGSRYKLEVDHCQPVALGGGNELGNLRILCQAHNLWAARKAKLL